jgi:hypothetical protein
MHLHANFPLVGTNLQTGWQDVELEAEVLLYWSGEGTGVSLTNCSY